MQELPDAVYQQSEYLLIDSPAARQEVGDVITPLHKGWINKEHLLDLGKVLIQPECLTQSQCTVFKSVGMAAFDLALAAAIAEIDSNNQQYNSCN